MNRKVLLALAGAALAGGIATTSAQAAPVSGHLIGVASKGVETVRYDYKWHNKYRWYNRWNQRKHRWWWNNNHRNKWYNDNHKHKHGHHKDRRRYH